MYNFNAQETTKNLIEWIKEWFDKNGKDCNAIVMLSGGKDSTIVAALCAEALGKDRVIGIGMPDGKQSLNDADKIAEYLGIKYFTLPITSVTTAVNESVKSLGIETSVQAEQNCPPRARMILGRYVAQCLNGRVSNNCNFSENFLGYETVDGDAAGDFSPLGALTVTEIRQIGDCLGLPKEWVHKTPDDGLPSSTSDEAKFGFTYEELDKYLREDIKPSDEKLEKMLRMWRGSQFKRRPMATFLPKKKY